MRQTLEECYAGDFLLLLVILKHILHETLCLLSRATTFVILTDTRHSSYMNGLSTQLGQ